MNEQIENIEVSKMKDISISNALRYLVIGVEPLIIIYFFGDKKLVTKLITDFGAVGLPLFAFALGAIFYSIYKVSIHTWFIRWSHDWHKDSYRKYIINKYEKNNGEKISHWDAERFWYYLSSLEFESRNKYLENQSSMDHLVYQTGIMLIISPTFLTFSNSCSCVNLYFVIAGFIILLFGWFYAGFIEKYIWHLIRSLENPTRLKGVKVSKSLDDYAKEFGFKSKRED